MKRLLNLGAILTAALVAASASADTLNHDAIRTRSGEAFEGRGGSTLGAGSLLVNYNLSPEVPSWDLVGDSNNIVVTLDLAAAAGLPAGSMIEVTGVGWDVTIETVGASWLSELLINFDNSALSAPNSFNLRPSPTAAPGMETRASGGVVDLGTAGIGNLVLPDGLLRLEFHEDWDDVADAIDGYWRSGVLQIQATPEPASLVLVAAGLLLGLRRR